jgi:hypothetical protein
VPHRGLASGDWDRTESHQSSVAWDRVGTVNIATNFVPSAAVRFLRRVFVLFIFFLSGVRAFLSRVDFHTRFAATMYFSFASPSVSSTLYSSRVTSDMYATWGLASYCVLSRARRNSCFIWTLIFLFLRLVYNNGPCHSHGRDLGGLPTQRCEGRGSFYSLAWERRVHPCLPGSS